MKMLLVIKCDALWHTGFKCWSVAEAMAGITRGPISYFLTASYRCSGTWRVWRLIVFQKYVYDPVILTKMTDMNKPLATAHDTLISFCFVLMCIKRPVNQFEFSVLDLFFLYTLGVLDYAFKPALNQLSLFVHGDWSLSEYITTA